MDVERVLGPPYACRFDHGRRQIDPDVFECMRSIDLLEIVNQEAWATADVQKANGASGCDTGRHFELDCESRLKITTIGPIDAFWISPVASKGLLVVRNNRSPIRLCPVAWGWRSARGHNYRSYPAFARSRRLINRLTTYNLATATALHERYGAHKAPDMKARSWPTLQTIHTFLAFSSAISSSSFATRRQSASRRSRTRARLAGER